jgi:hypothetical protein
VVGFEVVDLLAEEQGPEVLAEELDGCERRGGSRVRSGDSVACVSKPWNYSSPSRWIAGSV